MTREAYLSQSHVQQFADHLAHHLSAAGHFQHGYAHRQSGNDWACESLLQAAQRYDWRGVNLADTSAQLTQLQAELRRSVREHDQAACRAACVAILDWGGVGKQKPTNLTALDTLTTTHGSLPAYFERVRAELHRPDYSTAATWPGLKMNSGYTKLYALLFDDFIIYDSRVGAALGLLVRKWCEDQKHTVVPEAIRFAYRHAPGTSAEVRNSRNPSRDKLRFSSITSGHHHTEQNLRANWLLSAALQRLDAQAPFAQEFPDPQQRLRALEAALFMIGYDVRPSIN